MTIIKKNIAVTAVTSPADIGVSIDTKDDYVVNVTPGSTPNIVIEPPEIVIVGSAAAGPQGPPGNPGPQGPKGDPGAAGATFTFTQLSPSAKWVIVHTLNKYPSVMIVDSGGTVIEPDIHYDSTTQVTVTFGSATSGKAYLN